MLAALRPQRFISQSRQSAPIFSSCRQPRSFSSVASENPASAGSETKENSEALKKVNFVIEARKSNIKQSPLKMKFLVSLIRDAWVPDALAQLKFSPKPRCADVALIVKRAAALAKLNHNAIPEELVIKEVMVTKGKVMKKMRFMGRGRTGVGYKRWSHVSVKVCLINFQRRITEAKNIYEKAEWIRRSKYTRLRRNAVDGTGDLSQAQSN